MKRGGERDRQPDSQREYSEERRRERQDSQTARESIVKRGGERDRQPDSQREYSEERRRETQTARQPERV